MFGDESIWGGLSPQEENRNCSDHACDRISSHRHHMCAQAHAGVACAASIDHCSGSLTETHLCVSIINPQEGDGAESDPFMHRMEKSLSPFSFLQQRAAEYVFFFCFF